MTYLDEKVVCKHGREGTREGMEKQTDPGASRTQSEAMETVVRQGKAILEMSTSKRGTGMGAGRDILWLLPVMLLGAATGLTRGQIDQAQALYWGLYLVAPLAVVLLLATNASVTGYSEGRVGSRKIFVTHYGNIDELPSSTARSIMIWAAVVYVAYPFVWWLFAGHAERKVYGAMGNNQLAQVVAYGVIPGAILVLSAVYVRWLWWVRSVHVGWMKRLLRIAFFVPASFAVSFLLAGLIRRLHETSLTGS